MCMLEPRLFKQTSDQLSIQITIGQLLHEWGTACARILA